MIQFESRTYSPSELSALKERLQAGGRTSPDPKPGVGTFIVIEAASLIIGFIAGAVFSVILFLLSKLLPEIAPLAEPAKVKAFLLAGPALAGIVIPFWVWSRIRAAGRVQQTLIAKDIAEGKAEILNIETARVLYRPMGRDEPFYLAECGPKQWIFLCGEYLAPHLKAGTFPSTKFQIVRAPRSKVLLEFVPGGDSLQAEEWMPAVDLDSPGFPKDGEILPLDRNEIEKRLCQSWL